MKERFWRKALAAAMALLLVSGNVPIKPVADLFGGAAVTVSAAELASGTCGDNVTWSLDDAGKLTISGTGRMGGFGAHTPPWKKHKSDITSVVIENGVTSIHLYAFYGCTSLTSVTIPDSVTSIDFNAFDGCTGLTSIKLPDSVTSIRDGAFQNCENLTSVKIPNSLKSITEGAFRNCAALTSITIPDSVTSIGSYAFDGCAALTSLTIPNSVTSIGSYAFQSCTGLTSITIPDSFTSITEGAFRNCAALTSITIPNSVTSIGDFAFDGCTGLTSIAIPDGVTSIGGFAFRGWTGLTSIAIPDGVTSIGPEAFCKCTSLTSIAIPDGVTTIGDGMFEGCTSLTSVEIPNGVTSIGRFAFERCTSLTSVKIPNGVTSIGDFAFRDSTGLTSIAIPDGVTTIGEGMFEGCTGLTSIVIPAKVTNIGTDAFYGCNNIADVYCDAVPKNLTWDETRCDDFKPGKETICYVPGKYLDDYNDKFGESVNVTFKMNPELPGGKCGENAVWEFDRTTRKLTIYGTGAMDDYQYNAQPWDRYKYNITSVVIEDGVTSIGEDAFYRCKNIADVYCNADPKNLTWNDKRCDDFKPGKETVCHVPAEYLADYNTKFGSTVNVTFVGDIVDMGEGIGEHLYGYSVSVEGDIAVNFFVELENALLTSDTAKMVFTVPNGSKTETQTLLVKDVVAKDSNKVVSGGKTYYVFKCSVSAKDMASPITAQMFDGDSAGIKYRYSVKDYADQLLAAPGKYFAEGKAEKGAAFVRAMLSYGSYAQKYFNEGTAFEASGSVEDVTIPGTFEYNGNASLPAGVTFAGATLSLKSETTLSLYFTGLPDNTVFSCEGKKVETAKNGSYVVARIRGIRAEELQDYFTVNFTGGSVTYNAMTYCYNVLHSDTASDKLKNVCCALYNYAQAAKAYSE
ncbi:MAG: leucine-rich repeat domain-containing protein [Oscillospiraceae bacterium]|nr:leucine-rich repeat domain-containing protein [Oscillospiraceae bacterium]